MKEALYVLCSILAGAAVATSFHGFWVGAWIGLTLLAFGTTRSAYSLFAVAGAYLGGVLFHILALGWMRCALSNAEALVLVHYIALGWAITALLVRALSFVPVCIAFPIAWTIGTAAPTFLAASVFGPPGNFYLNRIAPTQLSLPIAQIADITGMAGVEIPIAFMAGAIVQGERRPLIAGALLLISVSLYAMERTWPSTTTEFYRAALYHEPVPPTNKVDADIFVWPEGDRWQSWTEERWRRFASGLGGTVVVGAARVENGQHYNSVIVATGDQVRYVDKRFLVLGGETPSPVDWITGESADKDLFAVGNGPEKCECNGISIAVCICYETTIPGLVSNHADLIVNPGSERSAACGNGPATMLQNARMRAIESRTPVVRVVLGGYTALIDSSGTVLASTIDKPIVGNVRIDSHYSLYAAIGDWLTPATVIAAIVLYFRGRRLP